LVQLVERQLELLERIQTLSSVVLLGQVQEVEQQEPQTQTLEEEMLLEILPSVFPPWEEESRRVEMDQTDTISGSLYIIFQVLEVAQMELLVSVEEEETPNMDAEVEVVVEESQEVRVETEVMDW
jgi:hypothetical protein